MSDETNAVNAERLCSEIQLFDLCDLDSCGFKRARYCTNEELLAKFEAIREEDDRPPLVYDPEAEADEDSDFDEYTEFEEDEE